MAASLSSLAFISQKIIHQKSGHTFLLYGNVATDEQSCTLLATLASPAGAISFDTAALDRWWCATWTKTEFEDFATPQALALKIAEGLLHVKGWTKGKLDAEDATLKIVIDPTGDEPITLSLNECSQADRRVLLKGSAGLLTKLTEKAQANDDAKICSATVGDSELVDARAEIMKLKRQLAKRDHEMTNLKAELETSKESCNEMLREKEASIRKPKPLVRVPANHSIASVTKKRRLVQTAEFED